MPTEPALTRDVHNHRDAAELNCVRGEVRSALLAHDGRVPLVTQPTVGGDHRREENEVTERSEYARERSQDAVFVPVRNPLKRQPDEISRLRGGRVEERAILSQRLVPVVGGGFGVDEGQANGLLGREKLEPENQFTEDRESRSENSLRSDGRLADVHEEGVGRSSSWGGTLHGSVVVVLERNRATTQGRARKSRSTRTGTLRRDARGGSLSERARLRIQGLGRGGRPRTGTASAASSRTANGARRVRASTLVARATEKLGRTGTNRLHCEMLWRSKKDKETTRRDETSTRRKRRARRAKLSSGKNKSKKRLSFCKRGEVDINRGTW